MSTSTLVLLRHGESEWNKANLFTGWVDVDLTDLGRQQALSHQVAEQRCETVRATARRDADADIQRLLLRVRNGGGGSATRRADDLAAVVSNPRQLICISCA